MKRGGVAWQWWRARSRAAKALIVAAALVLVLIAIPIGEGSEPGEPIAAEAAERADPPAGSAPAEAPVPTDEPEPQPAEAEVAPAQAAAPSGRGEVAAVAAVIDGDTIRLAGGGVVRLVQIDAPELRGGECYAREATETLRQLLSVGLRVRIETDPALDQVDRYGRQLAYVFRGTENVNQTLVLGGAASVWFYRGARGRYAHELLAAARDAEAAGRGLWGACEATLDPYAAVSTGPGRSPQSTPAPPAVADGSGECHPAYEPCLPVVDDMNCPEVRALGKAPVRVKVPGEDPYRLDRDRDGIGCE